MGGGGGWGLLASWPDGRQEGPDSCVCVCEGFCVSVCARERDRDRLCPTPVLPGHNNKGESKKGRLNSTRATSNTQSKKQKEGERDRERKRDR